VSLFAIGMAARSALQWVSLLWKGAFYAEVRGAAVAVG